MREGRREGRGVDLIVSTHTVTGASLCLLFPLILCLSRQRVLWDVHYYYHAVPYLGWDTRDVDPLQGIYLRVRLPLHLEEGRRGGYHSCLSAKKYYLHKQVTMYVLECIFWYVPVLKDDDDDDERPVRLPPYVTASPPIPHPPSFCQRGEERCRMMLP